MSDINKTYFDTDFTTYEFVETKDGYPTLFSKYYNELCHSNVGSYEETMHNYVNALNISEQLKIRNETIVLEMGYGIGIGLLTTLDKYTEVDVKNKLSFHSLEIDEGLFHWSIENIFKKYNRFKWMSDFTINKTNGYKCYSINHENIEINIHIGDARKNVLRFMNVFKGKVHAFYQDPFSPSKNPHLWSVEWFEDLYQLGTNDAVLSTYSASTIIRKALLQSGWKFGNYLGFASKRGMTKAFKVGEMDQSLKNKVENSNLAPFRDSDL